MRHVRRLVLLFVGVLVCLAPAGSAFAQELSGQGPSNFHTVMTSPSELDPGLTVKVIENGARMEVRNTGPEDVVVLGYMSEPFLRIGRGGVFENRQSPAVQLSSERWGSVDEKSNLQPTGAPQWHRISAEPVARWYDQRVHWIVQQRLPPRVMADPDRAQRISTWTVPMRIGERELAATGELRWLPGPSPWPGILGSIGLAVLVFAVVWLPPVRRRALLGYGVLAGVVAAASVLHLALVAAARAGGFGAWAGAFFAGNLLQLLSGAVAFAGAALLVRGRVGGAWLAAPALGVLALRVAGYDLPVLWRSSSPFVGGLALDRALTVLVLGAGLGAALALVVVVRRGPNPVAATAGAAEAVCVTNGERDANGAHEPVEPARDDVMSSPESSDRASADSAVSRRRFVGVAGAAGAGGLVVGATGGAVAFADDSTASGPTLAHVGSTSVPFHGKTQAGITTPAQAKAVFLGWDLEPGADRAAVAALMRRWSDAAARLTSGRPVADDDRVAADAGACSLTVTFGFGAGLFDKVGLAARRPAALKPLPPFPDDALDPARGDGDLFVQVCADDGLVTFGAVRTLQRLAKGVARIRWQMNGFARSPGATAKPMTHRNLMGQIDGTNNPKPADPKFDEKIFVTAAAGPDQGWLTGGTYVVFRRIRMLLDAWDGLDKAHQERVIGRTKDTGAPLSGGGEHSAADFGKRGADGELVITANAHMRVAAPEFNRGSTMLRRGYSYHDGFGTDGAPDAGLLFVAWQHDPDDGFVPIQRKLARGDALSPFLRHEASGLFVIPPGCAPGGYVGQSLLEG
ncbi:iron uptake transporter deferrochelatase/peroxidase subunit [Embleya sp. NPDC127516]|uniref:iron uptake transporter deferrochelatase/peroxidase subunit n=1 Tax=Embleya sp. NPDC127516 TaxID=3363990 RepID=UPI0038276D05